MNNTVFVTNRGLKQIGRFNGQDYVFETNKELEIPLAAAKHIFGYGNDDKEPYFVRLGWMKINTDYEKAISRLAEFTFSSEPAKKVHLSAPVVERVAAPMPKVKTEVKGVAKVHALQ